MANSSEGQIVGLDLTGWYRARVIRTDDPMLEGRLGVFIPSIITEYPQSQNTASPGTDPIPSDVFVNQKDLGLASKVKRDNYIWARPGSQLVENGTEDGQAGQWKIPTVGTFVTVYFEDGDPNRPYWLPFTPTVDGDVIPGVNIGSGRNLSKSSDNWTDPTRKPGIEVLAEYKNGNVIYVDTNDDANSFVVRWANGHTLSIHHNEESGIVLETEKGHLLQLDENTARIKLKSHTGKAFLQLDEKRDYDGAQEGYSELNGKDRVVLTSPNVRLGNVDATERLILGDTFREEQETLNVELSAQFDKIAMAFSELKAAITQFNTTLPKTLLIPPAQLLLTSAGATLDSLGGMACEKGRAAASDASAALDEFEARKPDYLSPVSKTK